MRALAVAVLRQAVCDAAGIIDRKAYVSPPHLGSRGGRLGPRPRDPATREDIRADAYAWITTHSASLEFWCDLAGIDADTVIDGADGAIATVRARERAPGAGRPRRG